MATISSIKNEMHIASCTELLVLKSEADTFVSSSPDLLCYFINHVYREYNRKRFNQCGGAAMITPYDGGFRPIGYSPSQSGPSISGGSSQITYLGVAYEWPVSLGGIGASSGSYAATSGMITFTSDGKNYEFPAGPGGAGGSAISVSNGLATITINSVNYEWSVTAV